MWPTGAQHTRSSLTARRGRLRRSCRYGGLARPPARADSRVKNCTVVAGPALVETPTHWAGSVGCTPFWLTRAARPWRILVPTVCGAPSRIRRPGLRHAKCLAHKARCDRYATPRSGPCASTRPGPDRLARPAAARRRHLQPAGGRERRRSSRGAAPGPWAARPGPTCSTWTARLLRSARTPPAPHTLSHSWPWPCGAAAGSTASAAARPPGFFRTGYEHGFCEAAPN